MAEDVKEKPAFPLGEIVAKRRFTLYEKLGGARQVIVEFGKPVPAVIALASSLTVIGVGAHSSGNVLVLNAELSGRSRPFTCVFDTKYETLMRCPFAGAYPRLFTPI